MANITAQTGHDKVRSAEGRAAAKCTDADQRWMASRAKEHYTLIDSLSECDEGLITPVCHLVIPQSMTQEMLESMRDVKALRARQNADTRQRKMYGCLKYPPIWDA